MGAFLSQIPRSPPTRDRERGLACLLQFVGQGAHGSAKILTLDALDTLYRFKKPIGQQYIDVARRCGFERPVRPDDIQRAFKAVYKDLVTTHPNYGKATLANSAVWWSILIERTFEKATNGALMPDDLVYKLYSHFSSAAAYELFPDVKPLFERLKRSKRASRRTLELEEWKQIPVVGVITNSDPRVHQVLEDLGLKVGTVERQKYLSDPTSNKPMAWTEREKRRLEEWDADNDVDFVCTSYEAGHEKPNANIWDHALWLAGDVTGSQIWHYSKAHAARKQPVSSERINWWIDNRARFDWVHIGNDWEQDWMGSYICGSAIPLYLPRGNMHEVAKGWSDGQKDAFLLQSLDRVWSTHTRTFYGVPGALPDDHLRT